MSRIASFALIVVGLFGIYIVQFAGAAMLDPLRDDLTDDQTIQDAGYADDMDSMYEAVVKWVPLVASIGLIVVGVYSEFRRQRVTAARRGGGLP